MLQPTKTNKATTVADFVSCLLFSRTQAQIFHWQTSSFAKHNALGDYYDSVVGLVDSLVESYQGSNSNITGYSNNYTISNSEGAVVPYFEKLLLMVMEGRMLFGTDTDLQNIIDEIISLIKSTLYKLKKLS